MRDLVTTILDVLGLLLVAAGLAAAAHLLIGWACLVVAGAVVLGGSQLDATIRQRGAKS